MSAEQYRQYAAECMQLLARVRDPKRRAAILQMAAAWSDLAQLADPNRKDDAPQPPVKQQQEQATARTAASVGYPPLDERLPMKKVEEYRMHADECRQMARRARVPSHRDMLLSMAQTWDALAAHRGEHIARKERIHALENEQR